MGHELHPTCFENNANVCLKLIHRLGTYFAESDELPAACSILKKIPEELKTRSLPNFRGINVEVREGRYHRHGLAGAGDCYVQTPPPSGIKDWAKTQGKVAASILSIPDANDDAVSLVTLDSFQILNEESFGSIRIEELAKFGMAFQCLIESALQSHCVLNAH